MGTSNDKLRLSILAALSLSATTPAYAHSSAVAADASPPTGAQDTAPAQGAATGVAAPPAAIMAVNEQSLDTIIVTGSTSPRTRLNASVDVTLATAAEIEQMAPRATADVLSLIPGVFVEGTAGPVSNNYSVRGLPGGGQAFIMLEEDGMPILYDGGGADEYFQNDITIERVEAVKGGTSGILAVNGAGATINFLSKPINFSEAHGEGRLLGATYGEQRADLYYTAPIPFLGNDVAFSAGGYADSTKGVRSSPFTFQTYHFKGALEKRFGDGGFVTFTYKRWDEHDPYYADMPYRYAGGQITSIPGLNPQSSNITGPGFAAIAVPDSCATGNCVRTFSASNGIHGTGNQYRIDLELPVDHSWSFFARARFLQSNWDFNGVFPGSGSGNSGLTTAVNYLTPGTASPINSVLTSGLAAFPGTTQFGIRNLTNGQLIAASNVAALNALNGNGLLQQTVLNQQYKAIRDLGTDFGVKYNLSVDGWSNSLTVGAMYYRVREYNDQSAVATLINGVSNNSSIYDVMGLNSAGGVTGTLTNNGMINYGDWGAGIWSNTLNSISAYFNDELALLDNKLHLDFGLRREDVVNVLLNGNTAAVNAPVPTTTTGLARDVGSTFDGTYTRGQFTAIPTSWTVGANYALTSNLSIYGRHANGNQTNSGNNLSKPARVVLSEAGARYGGYGVLASATVFRTLFLKQNYAYIQPDDPAVSGSFQADSTTNGIELDATYRPTFEPMRDFSIDIKGTYQKPKLSNVFLGEQINGVTVNSAAASQYDGKVPGRTFQTLYSVTPSYDLPGRFAQLYLRYEYIGKIYADAGNGLALPGYGVLSVGGDVRVGSNLSLSANVYNVTNQLGLTEGNPRQGVTQQVVNGYFYGRGIVGPNAQVTLSYKF
ncbi:MAG: TonB-dependent receptor [Pseudomonadota bacterium]|nr:TonB-dependent receptor [Pseudomonadota bacterium]